MVHNSNQQHLLKQKIEKLINEGFIQEASTILNKYTSVFQEDKWLLTTKSVIHLITGEVELAEDLLNDGLSRYPFNADILFNLAYLYEMKKDFQQAYDYYLDAEFVLTNSEKVVAVNAIKNLKNLSLDLIKKQKIVVFVKPGLDNFIDDIINGLSDQYRVRKILVSSYDQIDQGMEWADICWFEWCDELVIYGSKHSLANQRQLICRLHRYEVFTNLPQQVVWENVDKLILVTGHLLELLKKNINNIDSKVSVEVVHNGVDLSKFRFSQRNKGYNLGYIGYIHSRKNPALLLQIMKLLVYVDGDFKLYIAGKFQDELVELYWNHLIKEMNLEENIVFDGWQEDIDAWLKDKNYLLSTSIHESFGYGIAEAMARGIKPVIHNFPFAEEIWDKDFLFSSIDEAVEAIKGENYNSKAYRKYIEKFYSLTNQISSLKKILSDMNKTSQKDLLVKFKKTIKEKFFFNSIDELTLFIPTFNRAQLVVSDIQQGHKLGNQKKVIVDDCSEVKEQKLLQEGLRKFKNIDLIIHSENRGVAATFKTAFDQINSKLTQFSGDDDLIFCYDQEEFRKSINQIGKDYAVVIPRYVVNLDPTGKMDIGYDRYSFNNKCSTDVLKHFFLTGEMLAFIAGAVVSTDNMRGSLPDTIFRVSEDYVALARYFARNSDKKVKVLESYVYIRRVSNNTLSSTTNAEKLSLHLLSLLISGYYSFSLDMITNVELLHSINQRGELIEINYGFGKEFTKVMIDYITRVIDLKEFLQLLNEKYALSLSAEEVPREILEFPDILQ